mmetsp:Transcript_43572/g.113475  ORF Transcript_43572/g.113475 Transcript_43572/m.113475 type:complete len:213 (-) Transcript_43572:577-1215(-)
MSASEVPDTSPQGVKAELLLSSISGSSGKRLRRVGTSYTFFSTPSSPQYDTVEGGSAISADTLPKSVAISLFDLSLPLPFVHASTASIEPCAHASARCFARMLRISPASSMQNWASSDATAITSITPPSSPISFTHRPIRQMRHSMPIVRSAPSFRLSMTSFSFTFTLLFFIFAHIFAKSNSPSPCPPCIFSAVPSKKSAMSMSTIFTPAGR